MKKGSNRYTEDWAIILPAETISFQLESESSGVDNMCGRYGFTPGEFREIRIRFNIDTDIPLFSPRYNIAPTQQAPVIANLQGANRIELFQWGLVPWWAKDPSIGNRMINARAATLADKPSFRDLLRKKRCLVLADGFYEWRKEGKGRVPMWFKRKSDGPLLFAGLWDAWRKPEGGILKSYTVITTEPNELIAPVHNRSRRYSMIALRLSGSAVARLVTHSVCSNHFRPTCWKATKFQSW